MTWEISYLNYPEAIKYSDDFNLKIVACVVESISPPATRLDKIQQVLPMKFQAIIDFDDFIQTPPCGYEMEYFLTEGDSRTGINSDLEIDCKVRSDGSNYVSISTSDVNLEGEYTVFINARTKSSLYPVVRNEELYPI